MPGMVSIVPHLSNLSGAPHGGGGVGEGDAAWVGCARLRWRVPGEPKLELHIHVSAADTEIGCWMRAVARCNDAVASGTQFIMIELATCRPLQSTEESRRDRARPLFRVHLGDTARLETRQ